MATLIALLKGVNVTGKKMVPMATFRDVLEKLGGTEAKTLLQSGNAVLNLADGKVAGFAERLAEALSKAVGFEVTLVVRTLDELETVVAKVPWPVKPDEGKWHAVFFLSSAPTPAWQKALDVKQYAPDVCAVRGEHIYAHFPKGVADSKLSLRLGKPDVAEVSTARNWNTVLKLQALARTTAEVA